MKEFCAYLFLCFTAVYVLYNIQVWFIKETIEELNANDSPETVPEKVINEIDKKEKIAAKQNKISLHYDNACSVLEIFTQKGLYKKKRMKVEPLIDNDSITTIGITVFLLVLLIQAIIDAINVKEEETTLKKLYKNRERRQSLSEFAKKKQLRRESSKFGCQLFQITESLLSSDDKKVDDRNNITRGDSTTFCGDESVNANEGSTMEALDPEAYNKKQSLSNLVGKRTTRMVRRSTAPALCPLPTAPAPLLPALGRHRPASVDIEEDEGKGKRVRIIRRY